MEQEPTTLNLRLFGVFLGVALGLFALWRWMALETFVPGDPVALPLACVGGLALVVGLVMPRWLQIPYRGFRFVGRVNTAILLTVVWVLFVVPVGLGARLIGRDWLRRRPDRSRSSYWEEPEPVGTDLSPYRRQH